MISLDVVSMYTNISVDLAIECVGSRWKEIEKFCSIPKDEFLYMLRVCVSSTVFQFEDKYYHQIQGLAMGGSASSVLAEIVMENLELTAHCSTPFLIYLYKRYVDDVYLIVHKNDINGIHQFFNSLCPDIQFTLEVENDGILNFLDMSVVRKDCNLFCKWFQKPTASGRYLNYLSVQPSAFKSNVVHNLARRAYCLSDHQFRAESISKGKQLLIENCYPKRLIDSVFDKVLKSITPEGSCHARRREDYSDVICLPYVPLLSENLASMLNSFGFKVVHTNFNNLKFLMSPLKTKQPVEQQAGVIYKLLCSDCGIGYVGQTGQQLKKRIYGHKYNRNEKTALHQHEDDLGHRFDLDAPRILATEKHKYARNLLEMIYIVKDRKNLCNYRADVDGLGVAYHQFFQGDD